MRIGLPCLSVLVLLLGGCAEEQAAPRGETLATPDASGDAVGDPIPTGSDAGLDATAVSADATPIEAGGVDTSQCPVNPTTQQPICPPYAKPAVFISPHQDDETLGMGGAIRQHVKAGRPVFVELMTDGRSSGVRTTLANGGIHPWHAGTHQYALTPAQFSDARTAEFLDACAKLGVTGVFLSGHLDGALTAAQVQVRIAWWRTNSDATLSIKGTASGDAATFAHHDAFSHPDHNAVWSALVSSGYADIRGYLVYHHDPKTQTGTPSSTITLASDECAVKGTAIAAYKLWSPPGRYAIGYHSVPALFDSAGASCKEYLVLP